MVDGAFVGRTDELARFRALLADLPTGTRGKSRWRACGREAGGLGEDRRSRVVLVHGLGGIGKSRLLGRFREMADGVLPDSPVSTGQVRTVWLDFEDEQRDKPALYASGNGPVLVTLLDAVQQAVVAAYGSGSRSRDLAGKAFAGYRDGAARMPEYWPRFEDAIAQSNQAGTRVTSQDVKVLVRLLASAGLMAGGHPAGLLGVGPGQIAESAQAAGHLSEAAVRAVTGRKSGDLPLPEYELVTGFVRELPRRAAAALRTLADARPVVFFVDTGEVIGAVAWGWLRSVMKQSGPRVMWVVGARFETEAEAGADSPVAQFVREIGTAHLALMVPTRFDDETVGAYLTGWLPGSDYSADEVRAVARFTRGLPLAVGLTADVLGQGEHVQDVCQEIHDGLPSRIVSEVTRRLLVHAEQQDFPPGDVRHGDMMKILGLALAYGDLRTDPQVLETMWEVADPLGAFNDLASRHDFVLDTSRRLHDEVRDTLRIDLLDPYRRPLIREMNARSLRLYNDRLAKMRAKWPTLDEQLSHAGYCTTLLAALWHTLWDDLQTGLDMLIQILPVLAIADQAVADAAVGIADGFAGTFNEDQRNVYELLTTASHERGPQ